MELREISFSLITLNLISNDQCVQMSLFYNVLIMKEQGVLDRLYVPYLKAIQKSCPNDITIRPILKRPNRVSINTTFSLYLIHS